MKDDKTKPAQAETATNKLTRTSSSCSKSSCKQSTTTTASLCRQKPKLIGGGVKRQQPQPQQTSTATIAKRSSIRLSRPILKTTRPLSQEQLDELIAQSPNPSQRLCELIKRSKSAESVSPTRRQRATQRGRSLSNGHSMVTRRKPSSSTKQQQLELELIDKFFSPSSKSLSLDKKKQIFAQLVNLVASKQQQQQNKQVNRVELDEIVNTVRREISELKNELNTGSNTTTKASDEQFDFGGETTTTATTVKKSSPQSSDLEAGLKRIVDNYANNLVDGNLSPHSTSISVDRLQSELSDVNERNRLLQLQLSEKNKQIERYSQLFLYIYSHLYLKKIFHNGIIFEKKYIRF